MKLRRTRMLATALLATTTALATSAAPASAAVLVENYANFDGLAVGGTPCNQPATPTTVSTWEINSTTGEVEFCPGNLNSFTPPEPSHLEAQPGTTTLQVDADTNPIYTYLVTYTVDADTDTLVTEVTAAGSTQQCTSDVSDGPASCFIQFSPTDPTTTVTVTIDNTLATNVSLDDLFIWVPA